MVRTCSLLFVLAFSLACHAQDRVALLIGNSNYGGSETLLNPSRDVDAMKSALEALGFAATVVKDANQAEMENAIVSFSKVLGKGKVGFFFYAGHGMQVEGINYMIPTGATIRAEFDVKRKCVDVGYALEAMESAENSHNVVVLDCCRDNRFKRSWSRSTQKGLAAISDVPDGTFVVFSTAPGQTADDGRGVTNSPFTASLVSALKRRPQDGLRFIDLILDVGSDVRKKNGQRPWMNLDASVGHLYLWRRSNPGKETVASTLRHETAPHQIQLKPSDTEFKLATFGGGVFWRTEAVFEDVKGVQSVVAGYSGGQKANPTYSDVCAGDTGHAQVVQIKYDPQRVSFVELLEIFWQTHDPTTLNRQGYDIGTQYRSAIFYHDDGQKRLAEECKINLAQAKLFPGKIVTEITKYSNFYTAENYHQDYYKLNPNQPYCRAIIAPVIQKFHKSFKGKLKEQ